MAFVIAALIALIFAGIICAALVVDLFKNFTSRMSTWMDIGVDIAFIFGMACVLWVAGQVVITNCFG